MLRPDLARRIAGLNPHLTALEAQAVVKAILGRISDALVAGDRVELRGFGSFVVRTQIDRTARNPKTGAAIIVRGKRVVTFRSGKTVQGCLNEPKAPG